MCLVALCHVKTLKTEQKKCFSQQQCCFIAKHSFLNQCSYAHTKIAFEERLEINLLKTLICRIIIRFEQQRTIANQPKSEWVCVRTIKFKQQVTTTLVATPHISFFRLMQHVNDSHSNMYCTMRSIAYPY